MYNLICFPHYTCGGLLTDILNNSQSSFNQFGGLSSFEHNIGKIGDSDSIFTDFSQEDFDAIITKAKNHNIPPGKWLSTHCHPKNVSVKNFSKILLVTTTTYKSKIYRWARAYHHYYKKSVKVDQFDQLQEIDKHRETAKNYLTEFDVLTKKNINCIEFSEIVEEKQCLINLVNSFGIKYSKKHLEKWKSENNFLYSNDFWGSFPVVRYYEAEYEVRMNKSYIYK